MRHHPRQRVRQTVQILAIAGAVSEPDVERTRRLVGRIVVELMQGAGEDVRVVREDGGGAVAVVHVTVNDREPLTWRLALDRPDCDRHVVEQTEALAVARIRVMKPAANMTHDSALEGEPGRRQRATRHQTKPLDDDGRPGNLETRRLGHRQTPVTQLVEVDAGVDERELVPGRRRRLDEGLPGAGRTPGEGVGDQPVLRRGIDVEAEVDVVARRVDDAHGASRGRGAGRWGPRGTVAGVRGEAPSGHDSHYWTVPCTVVGSVVSSRGGAASAGSSASFRTSATVDT